MGVQTTGISVTNGNELLRVNSFDDFEGVNRGLEISYSNKGRYQLQEYDLNGNLVYSVATSEEFQLTDEHGNSFLPGHSWAYDRLMPRIREQAPEPIRGLLERIFGENHK
jgi:hypothetical protein